MKYFKIHSINTNSTSSSVTRLFKTGQVIVPEKNPEIFALTNSLGEFPPKPDKLQTGSLVIPKIRSYPF